MVSSSDRSMFQFPVYWYSDDRSIQFSFNMQKSGRNRAFCGHWSSPVFLTNISKYRLDRQLILSVDVRYLRDAHMKDVKGAHEMARVTGFEIQFQIFFMNSS